MNYYLGLIGLGLFFVLVVHIYNRWLIIKHEQEQLAKPEPASSTPSSTYLSDKANHGFWHRLRSPLRAFNGKPQHLDAKINATHGQSITQSAALHNRSAILQKSKLLMSEELTPVNAMQKPHDLNEPNSQHNEEPSNPHPQSLVAKIFSRQKSASGTRSKSLSVEAENASPANDEGDNHNAHNPIDEIIIIRRVDIVPVETLKDWLFNLLSTYPLLYRIEYISQEEALINPTANRWATCYPVMESGKVPQIQGLQSATALAQESFKASFSQYPKFHKLRLSLQLGNRRGTLSGDECQNFFQSVNQFCIQYDCGLSFSHANSVGELIDRVRHIDQLSADFDVQIVLTLICREPTGFSGGQISRESAKVGLIFDRGLFKKLDDKGKTLFWLEFRPPDVVPISLDKLEQTIGKTLSLHLDIPCVVNGRKAFEQMAQFAQHLATVLQSNLVDDRHQTLSTSSLETIGLQVEQIQQQMIESGVPAGSPTALRLFS